MTRIPKDGDLFVVVSIEHTERSYGRNYKMLNVGDVSKIQHVYRNGELVDIETDVFNYNAKDFKILTMSDDIDEVVAELIVDNI